MCSETSLNHTFRSVWNSALGAMVAVPESASGHGGGKSRRSKGALNSRSVPNVLTLCVALAWGGLSGNALANPEGGVVIAGQANMVSNGNQLLVTTQNAAGTNHSAINWQSFSIPAGNSTYFQQPSATSTVINQVVTSTPSLIFGTLGSNGNLVLINQSGITVGAGAVVDTAGFTASALRMSDADARAGVLNFGDNNASDGTVSVQGNVLARSGDVVLLGSHVDTGKDALIQAPNGSTLLAAGQKIDITGRGLEGISLEVQAPADSVVNLGTLQGDAVGIFAATLKHSGSIQANAVSTEGGKVVLRGGTRLDIDGSVQASALGQHGGTILASAQNVVLGSAALLDASGALGGGEVLVGGGYQGHDTRLTNAETTDVKSGAQLKADALTQGDGGTVVVWADGATRYAGAISAQGGATGGNGGRAEVSGKQYLDFQGLADLRAAEGKRGSLLLDPTNIIITNSRTADIDGTGSGYGTDIVLGSDLSSSATYGTATSQITASQVSTLLDTTDVALAATDDITINSNIGKTGSATTTLTLNAGQNINLYADVGSSAGALNFTASAGGTISGSTATVTTNGGNITMTAGTGISAGSIVLNANGADASSGPAGNGGVVKLTTSDGQISTTSVTANGGAGSSSSVNGGSGGSILISAKSSCPECTSSLSSMSTAGGSGYGAGVSGQAGSINIAVDHLANMSSITAKSLVYSNSMDSIDLSGVSLYSVKSLSLTARDGITATTSGVSDFAASVTGTGNLSYTNTGVLTISSLNAANGNITIDNTGGITTTGAVKAPNGTVSIEAHSPLTIGSGGVTAGGGVTLTASTDLTLNGQIQSTGGGITLAATGGNLVQNAGVIASGGVTATAGGAMSFGPNGYSSGNPLSYSDSSGTVSPPLVPLSALVTSGGSVSDFLDEFLAALDAQESFSDDPFDPRNRRTAGLVVEGQICTP